MSLHLNLWRIQYECDCGSWYPLSYMYFCRPCNHPRCSNCTREDADSLYCTSCLDDTLLKDGRSPRGTCSVCYMCPICGHQLIQRCVADASSAFMHCNTCMWSSYDGDVDTVLEAQKNVWANVQNPLEDKLRLIKNYMVSLATFEKEKVPRRSMSNLGHVTSDRFGVHQLIQNRRKKLLPRPESIETLPAGDVPELDDSIFTDEVDESQVLTLDQVLKLPFCNPNAVQPIPKKMACRKHVRCPEHDVTIYRSDYSVIRLQPKNYIPCTDFCPEIKFSGVVEFSAVETFSVFVTVQNSSFSPMEFEVEPVIIETDPDCLICNDRPNACKGDNAIPNKDNTVPSDQLTDLGGALDPERLGTIVFRTMHRLGLHFKCTAQPNCNPDRAYLLLSMTYKTSNAKSECHSNVKLFIHHNE